MSLSLAVTCTLIVFLSWPSGRRSLNENSSQAYMLFFQGQQPYSYHLAICFQTYVSYPSKLETIAATAPSAALGIYMS